MNLNIFWSIYILTFSLAMLIIWYFTYFKKRNKENGREHCSNATIKNSKSNVFRRLL